MTESEFRTEVERTDARVIGRTEGGVTYETPYETPYGTLYCESDGVFWCIPAGAR